MNDFFSNSELLDYLVLRPLSHIRANWELSWDLEKANYEIESDSYAEMLNKLIDELGQLAPPLQYHLHEDCLAEYVINNCHWAIYKVGNRWEGLDYDSILENGGFYDVGELNLMLAAAGRIKAAINRNQNNFDDMERSHRRILAAVISIILYHRTD